MKVRYFGAEDLNEPVGADGLPRFNRVYRGDFDENELFLGEYRWDSDYNRWIDTRTVSAWWFMGEASLVEITEAQAFAFIDANRPRNEAGEPINGVNFPWLAETLLRLEIDEPWVNEFNFGQWQGSPWNEEITGYCQVLRVDESNWWVEFSSDQFNKPKLTDRQKQAILDAGFAEPAEVDEADDVEDHFDGEFSSPNYSIQIPSQDARAVVELLERVFNLGGFVD